MGTNETTNTPRAPQMTPPEMTALAKRLRARANSVLMKDQPHQAADMRTAAGLVEQLAHLRAEIQRLLDEVKDEVEQQHLRELLGGL
jgi:transposase